MDISLRIQDDVSIMGKRCCIYMVPKKLRRKNKEAFEPQVVSIGPLHHGRPHLQAMRLTKEVYRNQFLQRTGSSMDHYRKEASEWEKDARACYEDIVNMKSEEFIDMMLVDGMFVVEVFIKIRDTQLFANTNKDDKDEIQSNELFRNDVLHDMMLLENQLPLFVIEKLYNSINCGREWGDLLFAFAQSYFKKQAESIKTAWVFQAISKGTHLIDFYHIITVCSNPSVQLSQDDILKYDRYAESTIFELSRTAKELEEAGVEFERIEYLLPFDLDFKETGKFLIPVVTINRWTETFFLNLIAYEHCLRKEKIITSFVVLMANLIDKPKDVEVLVRHGIIVNKTLGNNEDVCALFRNLYQKSMMNNTEFFYKDMCNDLNKYSKNMLHQWKAKWYKWKQMLKENYFSTPWALISFIAGFIALVLTVISTICSVVDTTKSQNDTK